MRIEKSDKSDEEVESKGAFLPEYAQSSYLVRFHRSSVKAVPSHSQLATHNPAKLSQPY